MRFEIERPEQAEKENRSSIEYLNKEFPNIDANRFLRDMSALNDDNQGRPLSAEKWRNIDDVID